MYVWLLFVLSRRTFKKNCLKTLSQKIPMRHNETKNETTLYAGQKAKMYVLSQMSQNI